METRIKVSVHRVKFLRAVRGFVPLYELNNGTNAPDKTYNIIFNRTGLIGLQTTSRTKAAADDVQRDERIYHCRRLARDYDIYNKHIIIILSEVSAAAVVQELKSSAYAFVRISYHFLLFSLFASILW